MSIGINIYLNNISFKLSIFGNLFVYRLQITIVIRNLLSKIFGSETEDTEDPDNIKTKENLSIDDLSEELQSAIKIDEKNEQYKGESCPDCEDGEIESKKTTIKEGRIKRDIFVHTCITPNCPRHIRTGNVGEVASAKFDLQDGTL